MFTKDLQEQGLQPEDVLRGQMQNELTKRTSGIDSFYKGITTLTDQDKECIDISKPFQLYSGNVRLKLHEKLNIMEREIVVLYRRKLAEKDHELEMQKSLSTDLSVFQEILAKEKEALEMSLLEAL